MVSNQEELLNRFPLLDTIIRNLSCNDADKKLLLTLFLNVYLTGQKDCQNTAVTDGDDQVTCPCGEVIDLTPDPEAPPVLSVGDKVYLPCLVEIECPKCGAQVRLEPFFKPPPQRPQ